MNYLRAVAMQKMPPTESYLCELPVVKQLNKQELAFSAPVTFFVGENGTGKSTLLEAIAVAMGFNPEGGGRNFTFSTNDSHSELWRYLQTVKSLPPRDGFFLRAESVYNLASNIDEMDKAPSFDPPIIKNYGGVSLHEQSHGESFLAMVQHRFGGEGLYLLDEPEAALSPTRQMTLLLEMERLVKARSQLIVATHSPILLSYPQAEIYEFSENGIVRKAYRDTEHYRITKLFLDNPERMLQQLLKEE